MRPGPLGPGLVASDPRSQPCLAPILFIIAAIFATPVGAEPGEAVNVTLKNRWADGPSYAIAAVGDLTYCGTGGYAYLANDRAGLLVVDVSGIYAPVIVGRLRTGGDLYRVSVLGDWEDGVYLLSNDLIQPTSVDAAAPRPTLLRQNAPNPFNPRTVIPFELPRAAHVDLAVFSVDGRRIATLVDGTRDAGPHRVPWLGRDDAGRPVASGTYFYRLEADGRRTTKGMVLLR